MPWRRWTAIASDSSLPGRCLAKQIHLHLCTNATAHAAREIESAAGNGQYAGSRILRTILLLSSVDLEVHKNTSKTCCIIARMHGSGTLVDPSLKERERRPSIPKAGLMMLQIYAQIIKVAQIMLHQSLGSEALAKRSTCC